MSKFVIVATFLLEAGRMDDCLSVLRELAERSVKDEPGTLQFDVLCPQTDDNTVMLYEVYTDEEAFDLHWNGPLAAEGKRATQGMVLNASGIRCDLLD